MLWDFSKKEKCNNIIRNWKMIFQASNLKGNYFLKILDNDYCMIIPTYTKGGSWINYFSHSNSLYARATRVITNHILIEEYYLRFFLKENFSYLYESYSIKLWWHILHECRKYNKYCNLCRTLLSYFIAFPEYNLRAFFFYEGLIYHLLCCSFFFFSVLLVLNIR